MKSSTKRTLRSCVLALLNVREPVSLVAPVFTLTVFFLFSGIRKEGLAVTASF